MRAEELLGADWRSRDLSLSAEQLSDLASAARGWEVAAVITDTGTGAGLGREVGEVLGDAGWSVVVAEAAMRRVVTQWGTRPAGD